MSLDTALNILAVVVATVAVFYVRKALAYIHVLPQNIMPAMSPIMTALSELEGQIVRLVGLLKEETDRQQALKNLSAENAELRRLNSTLEHKVGIKEGETAMLNDIASRQAGVINSQKAQIDKSLVAIREQTAVTDRMQATIERQQALIEEITRALPNAAGGKQ